ncbi:hypothetical protein N483_16460 [Pseudoalteromonas luteoviolacea NCIMB 1944]|nr:hypothetical protein N483_16460 [Pseudoalteromonas luteoviolacea NCIMB 1944]
MTDLIITLVLLLVSVGMAFQGKVLKANMADKDAENAKKIEKKANLLVMCGSFVAIIQVIKLGSFLL